MQANETEIREMQRVSASIAEVSGFMIRTIEEIQIRAEISGLNDRANKTMKTIAEAINALRSSPEFTLRVAGEGSKSSSAFALLRVFEETQKFRASIAELTDRGFLVSGDIEALQSIHGEFVKSGDLLMAFAVDRASELQTENNVLKSERRFVYRLNAGWPS